MRKPLDELGAALGGVVPETLSTRASVAGGAHEVGGGAKRRFPAQRPQRFHPYLTFASQYQQRMTPPSAARKRGWTCSLLQMHLGLEQCRVGSSTGASVAGIA